MQVCGHTDLKVYFKTIHVEHQHYCITAFMRGTRDQNNFRILRFSFKEQGNVQNG